MARKVPAHQSIRFWFVFATVVGIIHLITTLWLALPRSETAISKLAQLYPPNRFTILDPVLPRTQPLPFILPETQYAVCPFDLSRRAIRINALLPGPGWVLSIHDMSGRASYYAPGTDERPINLVINVVPPGNALNGLELSASVSETRIPTVIADDVVGIAVLHAPLAGRAYQAQAIQQLAKSKCRPVGLPKRNQKSSTSFRTSQSR